MLTYLYVHPMDILLSALILANHEPVHWTIKCEGWKDLTYEVQQDQYLDEVSKRDLISYFKTKVEESCDFEL